jgi:molecular chaperone HscB
MRGICARTVRTLALATKAQSRRPPPPLPPLAFRVLLATKRFTSSSCKAPCGAPVEKCTLKAPQDADGHPCWSCGYRSECSSQHDFMCSCGAVQPVDGNKVNFYEVFGCPMGVAVDGRTLERRFLALQRRLHPDKFAQDGPEQVEMSGKTSAAVNSAYQILRDPVSRVQYLLRLLGVNVLEEDSRTKVPPEVLAEVYDVRERLEESESLEEAEKILGENRRAMDSVLDSLQAAFERGDLEELSRGAVRLQYLAKIQEEAQRLSFHLEDAIA